MPRLLLCTDTWPPQVNGVSVVSALTVEGLTARGWDCAVVAPRYPQHLPPVFGEGPAAAAPVTSIPSLPMPGYPDLRLARPGDARIARAIEQFRPDLVHCATEFAIGWTGLRTARQLGIPVTTSYHTDFARYTESYGVPWLRGPVDRHLARFHRTALRTLTPSDLSRQELLRLGVTHGVTWGRGVDVTQFHRRKRSELLRDAYARPGAFIFLHVGRLAAEKGVERIVRAFHLARRELPDGAVHLIVAGSGPRERAVRAEGTEHATFLGALDRQEVLPRLYASADAFVFSSLTETLGLVILEAMASGLPVIATPAGGVAEHLVDGVNGLAYAPTDVRGMAAQMVRIASDHILRQRLAVGARATAQRLSWSDELDRLDTLYRELVSTHHRHAPAGPV